MKMDSIKVENYRGLKDVSIPLSSFVCIIGENNSGKSSTLLALSLFINGTALSKSDYYDVSKPITIEVELSNINDQDLKRLADEHRQKINDIIVEGKLTLVRRYETDGSANLLYKKLAPIDKRYDTQVISDLLSGKKGLEIRDIMKVHLPEHKERFESVKTQAAAKDIVESIVKELPINQLEKKDASLPSGIPNSIKLLLPEPILIPAVKDIGDDVKAKESATFGKIISVLLKVIEEAEQVQEIVKSFDKLKGLLNKVQADDGTLIDERLDEVKNIEALVNSYLKENFPKTSLELKIPPPGLKQVFATAQIYVDDGVKDIVDTKGDGLKRAVTFALLRSYIEMKKKQKLSVSTDKIKNTSVIEFSPYIFLFEEPELYLYPTAQKILFQALSSLSEDHQVIVTTHSPLFFSPTSTGTFVKMKKVHEQNVRPYAKPIYVDLHNDMSKRDLFQLLFFENNSAAFFADKVVLVEGDSDLCFFKHISKKLNEEWDFDSKNIHIVRIYGKGNVRRYKEFFSAFEVDVHTILDLDVLVKDFDKLGVPDALNEIRSQLLRNVDATAEIDNINGLPNGEAVKAMIRRYSWRERYDKLKELAQKMRSGVCLTDQEIYEIDLLFSEETETKRKRVLQRTDLEVLYKKSLLKSLRENKIYVLSKGTIEDYYPDGVQGEDKTSKALSACTLLSTKQSILATCPLVNNGAIEISEFEAIFSSIFN